MEKETGMLFLQRKLAQETLRQAGKGVPLARPYYFVSSSLMECR